MSKLQAQVAKSQEEERRFAQFKADSEKLEAQLETLKGILPQEKETDQILRQAQRARETSELRIVRLGPRATVDHDVYTEWPIDMEIIGTYHNIGTFLDKIRLLPRIVNISAMKIQAALRADPQTSQQLWARRTRPRPLYKEEVGDEHNESDGSKMKYRFGSDFCLN